MLLIRVNTNYITVYSNEIKILEKKFNPVGDITVKNAGLAEIMIGEFLNDMRVYTPGTYFGVPKESSKVEVVDDEPDNVATGIWIG